MSITIDRGRGGEAVVHLGDALERLDAADGCRLLLECHRVLGAGGQLHLELPDFDAALEAWRRGDHVFFGAGDDEALDARATAWFCTTRRRGGPAPDGPAGPPRLPRGQLHALRDRCSPMRLAIELAIAAIDASGPHAAPRFERQSAWSRAELAELLRLLGFEVRSALAARGQLTVVAEAIAATPSNTASAYRLHWHLHAAALRDSQRPVIAPSPTFATQGRHVGHLPLPLVAPLREALARCPIVPVTAEDAAPGYLSNPNLSAAGLEIINRDNRYFALASPGGAPALRALAPVLEGLRAPVRACLGTPWRVVNVRAWKTLARAARAEANGWHRDEPYPPGVLKVLLYVTEAGPETGTTEVVQPDGTRSIAVGPPGTFQIFENFARLHRGVPPSRGERWAVEITVAPHFYDDLRPVCAGQNADFPLAPDLRLEAWMPLEGEAPAA